jgi:hypothetical protein
MLHNIQIDSFDKETLCVASFKIKKSHQLSTGAGTFEPIASVNEC